MASENSFSQVPRYLPPKYIYIFIHLILNLIVQHWIQSTRTTVRWFVSLKSTRHLWKRNPFFSHIYKKSLSALSGLYLFFIRLDRYTPYLPSPKLPFGLLPLLLGPHFWALGSSTFILLSLFLPLQRSRPYQTILNLPNSAFSASASASSSASSATFQTGLSSVLTNSAFSISANATSSAHQQSYELDPHQLSPSLPSQSQQRDLICSSAVL